MMPDPLFRSLAPPPGGLEALRRRLDRRRRAPWRAVVLACALLLTLTPMLWLLLSRPQQAASLVLLVEAAPRQVEHPGYDWTLSSERLEVLPESATSMALEPVRLDERVLFYRVASLTPPP